MNRFLLQWFCLPAFALFWGCAVHPPAATPPPAEQPKAQSEPTSELYQEFVAAASQRTKRTLPDYSYAGYHYSAKPLPKLAAANCRVFDVTDYGAKPNDGCSDRDAAVNAFKAAHQHSGFAIIRFPEGRFNLNEPTDIGKPPLIINRNNIVLRGAGPAKTELFFAQPALLGQYHITVTSKTPSGYYWRGGRKLAKVRSNPKPGGFAVQVDGTSQLKPGLWVMLDADLNVNTKQGKSYFAPHAVPDGPKKGRSKKGLTDYMFEMHQIRSINGNQVTFNEPIHIELNNMESTILWSLDHQVSEVGIEDLALIGNYRGLFKHHNGSRFGEDFRMLRFSDAVDCWVQNIRVSDYSHAINFWRSARNTFMNIILDGNTGHFPITGQMSYGNLLAYIRENTDCHHGLGVSRSAVNTVFLRCLQYAGMEAHCGYARATLYDCNEGMFHTRGGGATFTPHHGKRLCFWNWKATQAETIDFWPEGKRYGYFMPPIIVGLHGADVKIQQPRTDVLANESQGTKVTPESLFEAQLARRLGGLPEWIKRQSSLFEKVTRYSTITIASPSDHTVLARGVPIPITLKLHANMDSNHVKQIEIQGSKTSRFTGFRTIATVPTGALRTTLKSPSTGGVRIIRARMTNSRSEVVYSLPVTIYVGNPDSLKKRRIVKAGVIQGGAKAALYGQFRSKGGGEGRVPKSKALAKQNAGKLATWQVETDYLAEMQRVYVSCRPMIRTALNKPEHIKQAKLLIDGKYDACAKLYDYRDALTQFDLGTPQRINRVDIHWKNGNPRKSVRLELLTSSNPNAWHSITNDEPLWESSVTRIGGTLHRTLLPGSRVTSLYFPERTAQYVRILLTSFPNEITEITIHGP